MAETAARRAERIRKAAQAKAEFERFRAQFQARHRVDPAKQIAAAQAIDDDTGQRLADALMADTAQTPPADQDLGAVDPGRELGESILREDGPPEPIPAPTPTGDDEGNLGRELAAGFIADAGGSPTPVPAPTPVRGTQTPATLPGVPPGADPNEPVTARPEPSGAVTPPSTGRDDDSGFLERFGDVGQVGSVSGAFGNVDPETGMVVLPPDSVAAGFGLIGTGIDELNEASRRMTLATGAGAVPGVGGGVQVVQPFQELADLKADAVQVAAQIPNITIDTPSVKIQRPGGEFKTVLKGREVTVPIGTTTAVITEVLLPSGAADLFLVTLPTAKVAIKLTRAGKVITQLEGLALSRAERAAIERLRLAGFSRRSRGIESFTSGTVDASMPYNPNVGPSPGQLTESSRLTTLAREFRDVQSRQWGGRRGPNAPTDIFSPQGPGGGGTRGDVAAAFAPTAYTETLIGERVEALHALARADQTEAAIISARIKLIEAQLFESYPGDLRAIGALDAAASAETVGITSGADAMIRHMLAGSPVLDGAQAVTFSRVAESTGSPFVAARVATSTVGRFLGVDDGRDVTALARARIDQAIIDASELERDTEQGVRLIPGRVTEPIEQPAPERQVRPERPGTGDTAPLVPAVSPGVQRPPEIDPSTGLEFVPSETPTPGTAPETGPEPVTPPGPEPATPPGPPEPEPEAQPGTEPEPAPAPGPEPGPELQPGPGPEPAPPPGPEPLTPPELEPEPEPTPEPEPEAVAQPAPEPEPATPPGPKLFSDPVEASIDSPPPPTLDASRPAARGRGGFLPRGAISISSQVPPGRFPKLIEVPAGAAELTFNTQTGKKIQAFDLKDVPDFPKGAKASAIRVRETTAEPPKFTTFDNGIVRAHIARDGRSIRFTKIRKPARRRNRKFEGDPTDPTPI